jgi:hypothetical protein
MSSRSTEKQFAIRRVKPQSRKPMFRKMGFVVLFLAVVGGGGWWFSTTDTFRVSRVESGAYRFTSPVELESVLDEVLGQNIWRVSQESVQALLSDLPWLRDLRLHRRLPGTIQIDFREWRPLLEVRNAAASGGDAALVLVEDGRVLEFPSHVTLAGLPVLVGVELFREGDSATCRLDSSTTSNLLELVSAFKEAGLEGHCPVDFIVARDEGYGIVLQDGQGSLLIGREDFAQRLNRYMDARSHLDPGLEVDLRFAERIITRNPSAGDQP